MYGSLVAACSGRDGFKSRHETVECRRPAPWFSHTKMICCLFSNQRMFVQLICFLNVQFLPLNTRLFPSLQQCPGIYSTVDVSVWTWRSWKLTHCQQRHTASLRFKKRQRNAFTTLLFSKPFTKCASWQCTTQTPALGSRSVMYCYPLPLSFFQEVS